MKNELGKEFYSYATKHKGISGLAMHDFYNYMTPNIIEERQMNVAIMSVFDRLLCDRILFLGTGIDSHVSNIINAQLLFLDSVDKKKDINIYISSGGGSVISGNSVISTMEYISADVSTTVIGVAASMAAVILACGTKGKRYGLKRSRVMIHQISSGTEGDFSTMSIALKEMERTRKELYTELAERTGKKFSQIEKDADRDYWMTVDEAKEYGLIDEVLIGAKK